jgi:hypothetical protein
LFVDGTWHFLGMAVFLYRDDGSQESNTMPISNFATDERLSQAAAHIQQAFSLIAAVDPRIVECLVSGTIIPTNQRSLSLDCQNTPTGHGSGCPTIIDEDTFRVHWGDRTCRLGNTFPFRLLARLARRPNQFISYEVLFRDVWKNEYTSPEAVRSVIKVLRRKLAAAGMADLAEGIDGSTSRHYALKIVAR